MGLKLFLQKAVFFISFLGYKNDLRKLNLLLLFLIDLDSRTTTFKIKHLNTRVVSKNIDVEQAVLGKTNIILIVQNNTNYGVNVLHST